MTSFRARVPPVGWLSHVLCPTSVIQTGRRWKSRNRNRKKAGSSVPQLGLGPEQQALVDLILTGRNVFYTGAAGTGKSLVLRTAVERLRFLGKIVQVVAPTGRAALAVKGTTTWRYAGWTPAAHARPLNLLRRWAVHKYNVHRLARTDVLVIDEISMVENHHLERLSEIMKEARATRFWDRGWSDVADIREASFGGCQVIATGDFYQLPPVRPFQHCIDCGSALLEETHPLETRYRCPSGHGTWPDPYKWAFRSEAWDNADFAHVELREVYRQAGDPQFIEMLNRIRVGTHTYDDVMVLANPNRKTKNMKNAVRLYPTRSEVAQYNQKKLRKLKTQHYDYTARDSFHWNELCHPHLKSYGERRADGTLEALSEHRFEPFLRLKVGMPVILLANVDIDKGMVNGSQGIINGFVPIVSDDIILEIKRYSVGSRKDRMLSKRIMDELFEFAVSATPPVMALPRVQFDNGVTAVILPDCSSSEFRDETLSEETDLYTYNTDERLVSQVEPSVLCRTQVPLAPGWAMSVHKAQGMTLGKVIVDLTKAFEAGQVYVALSRARSLDGLKVEGNPRGLMARREGNREVKEFYQENFTKRRGGSSALGWLLAKQQGIL